MNKKVGLISSALMTVMVILFALGMIIGKNSMSYFVCILLSWAYVLVVCSFAAYVREDNKVLAYAAVAFACIYTVIIDIVYFTQLTTVANKTASTEVLNTLSYETLGSWMFNLDLFGYGIMAISTLLIGLTITPLNSKDKWLKTLLIIHGFFAIVCILLPMLNIFNSNMNGNGTIYGTVVLLFWCSYFVPIGILSALHFKNKIN